ncbi:hypothetical protein Patl1_19863 [Pistacia atlantica]|uniref:Uncharacterized protein n=1 Tax=Pistacia atlantica TaxID=434234 RepID=A0ACC1BHT5_9ROSI|nr:hypothetical protein Patl1_19863 [Pistacia atlantica]
MKIFSKKLTKTDVESRLCIKSKSLDFFPAFEGGHHAQVLRVEDEEGKEWRFRLIIRRGRYGKPVLSAADWLRFIKSKQLESGFKVRFSRKKMKLKEKLILIDVENRFSIRSKLKSSLIFLQHILSNTFDSCKKEHVGYDQPAVLIIYGQDILSVGGVRMQLKKWHHLLKLTAGSANFDDLDNIQD